MLPTPQIACLRCAEAGELPLLFEARGSTGPPSNLAAELAAFRQFGQATGRIVTRFRAPDGSMAEAPTFVNEFWTAQQRQANSLQEISYRACFKPQLPRFFIERLSKPGDVVYAPFMGRGTAF